MALMQRNITTCCLGAVIGLMSYHLAANELDDFSEQAKDLIANYSSQLLAAYEQAYASGNLEAVAEICRNKAIEIANTLTRDSWKIHRITHAALNKNNRPDYTENKVLNEFEQKQEQGWKTDQLAWYKLDEIGNQSEFRYVKAFQLEERCMACHGAHRSADNSGIRLSAYALKRIETKNYFSEEPKLDQNQMLEEFEE